MAKKYVIDEPRKGNIVGILGICIGWLIPIVGLILGIVALGRKEDNPILGIVAIIESIVAFVITLTLMGLI